MYGIDQKVYKVSLDYRAEIVEIVDEFKVCEKNENGKVSRM